MINAKAQWLSVYQRENATTLKVMRAYPAAKPDFQPHPISGTAKRLMWTFVIEQTVIEGAVDGTLTMPPKFPEELGTIAEVIAAFEKTANTVQQKVAAMPDDRMDAMIRFFTGPGTLADVPLAQIMWLMLLDSVHHRGQLSVYLRMTGGKVPSIYGPSHDEPWM